MKHESNLGTPTVLFIMVFSLLLIMMGTTASASDGDRTIEVGQPFPDLPLVDLEGAPRRVSDFRGTKLVLHVFASW